MNRLLYCAEILAVLLFVMQSACVESENSSSLTFNTSENTLVASTQSQIALQSSSSSPAPQHTTSSTLFFKEECLQVLMVCGGLIVACTLFLILTLILLLKVCWLSKRLKSLGTSGEQIDISEYRVRTAERNEKNSEDEVKETDILMADMSQNKTEISNGTAKDEGQEGKEKEVENTPQGDEASPTEAATESSPSSKLQEEATNSEPTTDTPVAPASERTEELKGVE